MIVSGAVVRSVGLDSFADIAPGVEVVAVTATGIEFAADLTDQQQADVWARMTSRDDDDQAKRANLSDLLTNDTTASPLAKAVAAYLLGGAP